jgi:hypothetical protein
MKEMTATRLCKRCEEELPSDATFCGCGTPTPLASFKDRAAWEAKQWRAYKTRATN